LVKFMLTLLATTFLLLHTQPIGRLAAVARETTVAGSDVRALQVQIVGDAGAALLALLVNVTLSVYQPPRLTEYVRRKHRQQRQPVGGDVVADEDRSPLWIRALTILIVALMLAFVILHLAGGGLGSLHHG